MRSAPLRTDVALAIGITTRLRVFALCRSTAFSSFLPRKTLTLPQVEHVDATSARCRNATFLSDSVAPACVDLRKVPRYAVEDATFAHEPCIANVRSSIGHAVHCWLPKLPLLPARSRARTAKHVVRPG